MCKINFLRNINCNVLEVFASHFSEGCAERSKETMWQIQMGNMFGQEINQKRNKMIRSVLCIFNFTKCSINGHPCQVNKNAKRNNLVSLLSIMQRSSRMGPRPQCALMKPKYNPLILLSPEVPAATLHHFAGEARKEVCPDLAKANTCRKNASRDAHAFVAKWGLSWKVPMSYVDHLVDGAPEQFPFLSPKAWVKYLLEKTPELVLGGCQNKDDGRAHLKAFWDAYSNEHPSHKLFWENRDGRLLENTLCLSLHGDEGRGLKKSNTTVLMLETNLGLDSHNNMSRKRNLCACSECTISSDTAKRFCLGPGASRTPPPSGLCSYQTTNMKQHSFLTKYVIAVIPRKETHLLNSIMVEVTRDFISLFEEGVTLSNGERWFAAITGLKGDLKWFVEKVGFLKRCFNKQLATNTAMCHECLAGTSTHPFEDVSHNPLWGPTVYSERPFDVQPVACLIPFESTHEGDPAAERVFRRDIFHNTKVGILRDFVGSVVMLLCRLKYFHEGGEPNGREQVLHRAYCHFHLFCHTTGRSPGLRSFTATFFNAPSWDTFPWASSKGSDTSHLLAWIVVLVTGLLNDPKHPGHVNLLRYIKRTAVCARTFLRLIYGHGLWMNKFCIAAVYENIHNFLQGYNACAFLSMNQFKFTGFAMKSKFHMVAHAKQDIYRALQNSDAKFFLNMLIWGCEMNEDVIGKVCRLSRRVSTRKTAQRTMELVLIKSKALHRRWKLQNSKGLAWCAIAETLAVENIANCWWVCGRCG